MLKKRFDNKNLCTFYDRGHLVPLIGSGASIPACANWKHFVERLEAHCGVNRQPQNGKDLIQRALACMQALRQQGKQVARIIESTIYVDDHSTPEQTQVLSSLFWPLVCTTNYDDLYLRAVLKNKRQLPLVLGRSESDCRQMLQHLSFPASEVMWALQGFLGPRDPMVKHALGIRFNQELLEQELVVGHAEYRKAAHRAPHFRRCFSELFRTRSLLFIGSGLAEPYFRALFDEIIELTGPPVRPHFAIIEEGAVDPDFMRQQYHIICNTYPIARHQHVIDELSEFVSFAKGSRVRSRGWGFRMMSPSWVDRTHATDHFTIIRAGLPKSISKKEVVAISCGRGDARKLKTRFAYRGSPLASSDGARMIGLKDEKYHRWINDWTVRWTKLNRCFGIVAREPIKGPSSSRDRRSPQAIRDAFLAFLRSMELRRTHIAHVQLLAAGPGRVFQPWVSLVQMARAYGEWFREAQTKRRAPRLRVHVYVVDPGVIALLQGGFVDVAEQLEDTPLRIAVEVIDASGQAERYHQIVDANAKLREFVDPSGGGQPCVYARPGPRLQVERVTLANAMHRTAREFGLVSGSTLYIDYRASAPGLNA